MVDDLALGLRRDAVGPQGQEPLGHNAWDTFALLEALRIRGQAAQAVKLTQGDVLAFNLIHMRVHQPGNDASLGSSAPERRHRHAIPAPMQQLFQHDNSGLCGPGVERRG